jgi:hypothetical protein
VGKKWHKKVLGKQEDNRFQAKRCDYTNATHSLDVFGGLSKRIFSHDIMFFYFNDTSI